MPDGTYCLSEEVSSELEEKNIWAIFIGNDTLQTEWKSHNVPEMIPNHYSLSDIAALSVG